MARGGVKPGSPPTPSSNVPSQPLAKGTLNTTGPSVLERRRMPRWPSCTKPMACAVPAALAPAVPFSSAELTFVRTSSRVRLPNTDASKRTVQYFALGSPVCQSRLETLHSTRHSRSQDSAHREEIWAAVAVLRLTELKKSVTTLMRTWGSYLATAHPRAGQRIRRDTRVRTASRSCKRRPSRRDSS
eukprot:SAG31_NODE_3551_length_4131_cov_2.490575_3_plen_187_part_00